MQFRKIAGILLVLLILLSGCASKTAAEPKEAQNKETPNIASGENAGGQGGKEDSPTTAPTEGGVSESEAPKAGGVSGSGSGKTDEGNSESGSAAGKEDGGAKVVKIIPMAELPELTLEPQEPFDFVEMSWTRNLMLAPVYHKNFRYQVREFTDHPARLVIDIGNTGSETLVITDENFYFTIMDAEGNEAADSKLQGAPVSIAPGEIKRVVLTAGNPDSRLVIINFGGEYYSLGNPFYFAVEGEETDVSDTNPYYDGYVIYDDNGEPFVMEDYAMQVVGNGRAKMVACGLTPVENEKIGPFERGEGFLALVKLKIANTTGDAMTIDRLIIDSAGVRLDFTEEDMAVLGELALPYYIEPYSIVEGWIPFKVSHGKYPSGIVLYTSHGGFVVSGLLTYPVF